MLRDQLLHMKNMAMRNPKYTPDVAVKFQQILDEVNKLCHYFDYIRDVMEEIIMSSTEVSRRLAYELENNIANAKVILDSLQ